MFYKPLDFDVKDDILKSNTQHNTHQEEVLLPHSLFSTSTCSSTTNEADIFCPFLFPHEGSDPLQPDARGSRILSSLTAEKTVGIIQSQTLAAGTIPLARQGGGVICNLDGSTLRVNWIIGGLLGYLYYILSAENILRNAIQVDSTGLVIILTGTALGPPPCSGLISDSGILPCQAEPVLSPICSSRITRGCSGPPR